MKLFEEYRKDRLSLPVKVGILILRAIGLVVTFALWMGIGFGILPVLLCAMLIGWLESVAEKHEFKLLGAWMQVARHEIWDRALKVFEILS